MSAEGNTFKEFWTALRPASNRRTGFSIGYAGKRNFIYFDYVGFRFSYQLDWLQPDAMIAFTIVRSDSDEIFDYLFQRRDKLAADFGGSLRWLEKYPVPENRFPSPALVTSVACPGLRDMPPDQWPPVHAQMIDAMVRLEQAVAPQVATWLPD